MLYGRDAERDRIGALLEAARRSRSSALVVRGDPGVGKTALLEDTRERAQDMQVLTSRGVESESELPFAALHQLFRSSLAYAERIPAPQADALRAALGLADGGTQERFLISAACLSLLSELAERRPVLCLVDDAHWLDSPSADALLFVARRLDAEGVLMLFGARDGDARSFDARDIPSLSLSGLDAESSATLLARGVDGTVSRSVVDHLVAQTGGNALALLELPSALTSAQLAGAEPLPEALPLTSQVESVFLERVRQLPEETQRLLLVAAADETGDLRLVLGAARQFGAGVDALNAAEQAGLVSAYGTRVEFRHPLVRSALYGAATSTDRRAAHHALAAALGDDDGDRRAWHLASSLLEADEETARLVEAVAERAQQRGGYGSAARALERAAQLSPDRADRVRRLVSAARAASIAGQDEQAVTLGQRVLPLAEGPEARADVAYVVGVAELRHGRPPEGISALVEAARAVASVNPRKAIELIERAMSSALQGGDPVVQREIADLAATIVPPGGDEKSAFIVDLLTGTAAGVTGDTAKAAPLLARAMTWGANAGDPLEIFLAALAASWLGDYGRTEELLTRVIAITRERGQIGTLSEALSFRAAQLVVGQRFDEAAVVAGEGLQLARELGAENYTAIPLNVLAVGAAVRGEFEEAEQGGNAVLELARIHNLPLREGAGHYTLGLAEMGRGRWNEALEHFDAAVRAGPLITTLVALDRIEAAARADRRDHAVAVLADFERWAAHSKAPWARPRIASCRGLLATGEEASGHFEEAMQLSADARPFDLARIHLLYGEHLRRERRRADSRVHLRAALEEFDRMRAKPWAERAAAELRATGETARKRDPSTVDQLTPKEIQIARLVAEGLSNKEIAAQLFLSPRTIDYHLRNVFTKLGLTSRTQLARIPLDGEAPHQTVAESAPA